MKVLLKEDVYKHGVAGEVVSVADGFARNWLIPKGIAMPASKANLAQAASLREAASQNRSVYNEKVNAAARQIDGVELVFGVKAGSNNKLYGSITSQMIKDALLAKTGLDINRRRISERTIRELGRYDIAVRMGDVSPMIKLLVMREDEAATYLDAGQSTGESVEAIETAETSEPVAEIPVEAAADAPAEAATEAE
ncbi:MAG: 50S ribosomal protein L9 [Chloroflexota bacterium]